MGRSGGVEEDMFILGIWDGHDAGAALLQGDSIIIAVNEERLSRRKLEVGFPARSIKACLDYAGLSPVDIKEIAASTFDPAKTLTRMFPRLKEEYYLIRRRKKRPGGLDSLKKGFKYRFTEYGPNFLSRYFSRDSIMKECEAMGFRDFRLSLLDHHLCHAHAAARCSGFEEGLVLTLDGLGDGLSGSISRFRHGRVELLKKIPASVSLGVFFEHVTNLMNMRELEDEGKVMALANYAFPIEDADNPMMDLLHVENLDLVSHYSSMGLFRELKKILWQYPSEQFAYMAQKVLEKRVLELARNALGMIGKTSLAVAGGIFSNIKLNMKLAAMEDVERFYVFPHMGDGGLAAGAAIWANHERNGVDRCRLDHLYLGPGVGREGILSSIRGYGYPFRELGDAPETAARMILKGEILLWFQGRMELGPRALGNRSILARPDDGTVKDRLNLALKKRVWYQPFCPSMLKEDASLLLHTDGQDFRDNPFMTSAFRVREEHLRLMKGVINIDGTCRPHFVGEENPRFRRLLGALKGTLGKGVVLNTSLNVHGDPMVCTAEDALETLRKTGVRYLFMEDFLVENKDALAS